MYEGSVDIETIHDLEQRYALEVQIGEFGQVPKQLFSSPHPGKHYKGGTLAAIRYRGVGRVCFLPPLFCPTKFVKSSDQFFERKARRRRKNFEVTFFKKLTFLGKFYGF